VWPGRYDQAGGMATPVSSGSQRIRRPVPDFATSERRFEGKFLAPPSAKFVNAPIAYQLPSNPRQ